MQRNSNEPNPQRRLGMALLLCCGLSIPACGRVKSTKACNLSAEGLTSEALTGSLLPDLHLSLAFLKGPSEHTNDIAQYLEQKGIKAAFFVKGAAVDEYHDVLSNLREVGHLIGNASFNFSPLQQTQQSLLEVRKADELISPYVTGNMFLLHAPDGKFDAKIAALLNRHGLGKYIGPIQPELSSNSAFMDDEACWANDLSVSSCAQQYFTELVSARKGLVALHDEDSRSLELLDVLLPQLTAYGFQFDRLDQIPDIRAALLAAGGEPDKIAGEKSCNDYE